MTRTRKKSGKFQRGSYQNAYLLFQHAPDRESLINLSLVFWQLTCLGYNQYPCRRCHQRKSNNIRLSAASTTLSFNSFPLSCLVDQNTLTLYFSEPQNNFSPNSSILFWSNRWIEIIRPRIKISFSIPFEALNNVLKSNYVPKIYLD